MISKRIFGMYYKMASESNFTVYAIAVSTSGSTSTASITAKSFTAATVTDTGSGTDDLSILGDNNVGGHNDIFQITVSSGTLTYYYYGAATIAGVSGIIAQDGSGNWYFLTPSATGLSAGNSGTVVYDTTGTSSPAQWSLTSGQVICFMAGTLVATPEGEMPVERLQAGDMVMTADGQQRPVFWLGRQTVMTRFADPLRVNPVRIKAGALGEGLPRRDLLTSPDHAVLVDGILVHAGALVNGVSILREGAMPASFVYYHVELADHSLILAEGAAAETFIDNVDRVGFDNWREREAGGALVEMELPRAKAARQVPQKLRERLLALADALYGEAAAA
jgi:hypothetical protein